MAHKTTELKFNQGRKWISGPAIGLWVSSNYRLHKWICEYNTDILGCSMPVILNVFSCCFFFPLGCCSPNMESAFPGDETWCGLQGVERVEQSRFKSIHSSWSWTFLPQRAGRPCILNNFVEITHWISMGQRALVHAWFSLSPSFWFSRWLSRRFIFTPMATITVRTFK